MAVSHLFVAVAADDDVSVSQVITFLRKKDKFISLVLKHIDTSAMMDLLLRLISCVEPATLRQEVLNVRTCCFFSFPHWAQGWLFVGGMSFCLSVGSALLRAALLDAGLGVLGVLALQPAQGLPSRMSPQQERIPAPFSI